MNFAPCYYQIGGTSFTEALNKMKTFHSSHHSIYSIYGEKIESTWEVFHTFNKNLLFNLKKEAS